MFEEITKNCPYAYARVSSKSQEKNSSLQIQKQECIKQGLQKKIFVWLLFLLGILFKNDLFFKN